MNKTCNKFYAAFHNPLRYAGHVRGKVKLYIKNALFFSVLAILSGTAAFGQQKRF